MRKQRNMQIHWQIQLFFILTVLSSLAFLLNTPAVAAPGDITTVAGTGRPGFSGDGGPATEAELWLPRGVFVDGTGNIFIVDQNNGRIRRVDGQTSIITTVAGVERPGFSGDGGPATEARLEPLDVFVDRGGNIFIAGNNRIRRVDGQTGIITTVAGTGRFGFSGDGGKATEARLANSGVFVDGAGNLFIADWGNRRIRRVDGQTGIITTVAGTGERGFSGDGGKATEAQLNNPRDVFVDGAGNLFISDSDNHRIRRVDGQTGIITTVAGTGEERSSGDGGPATEAGFDPLGVFVDGAGNIFIADSNTPRIRRVDGQTGIITTIAGTGEERLLGNERFSGDGGPATKARLNNPASVFVDGAGNLFIADQSNHRIRNVEGVAAPTTLLNIGVFNPGGSEIKTPPGIVSTAPADNEQDVDPILVNQQGIVITFSEVISIDQNIEARVESGESVLSWQATEISADGTVVMLKPTTGSNLDFETTYTVVLSEIADEFRFTFTTQTAPAQGKGIITTVAGTGEGGFLGDEGPATEAQLWSPEGVFVNGAGNLFFADSFNHRVRRVDGQTGIITTVAGIGRRGFSGNFGKATEARLDSPTGVFGDGAGNLFIADTRNHRVRRVDGQTGIITTVAGTGEEGFSRDGEPANRMRLARPWAVSVDRMGNLFIADTGNSRILRVDGQTGIAITVAGGGGGEGFSGGDGGPATEAGIPFPTNVFVDDGGNLYTGNSRIRRVDGQTGIITTVAGTGERGFSGDGGPATEAQIEAQGVFVDSGGNLFIADRGNHRIRRVDGQTGIITTVAGTGDGGFSGDRGPATETRLNNPFSVFGDRAGNLFITDSANNRIRKVEGIAVPTVLTPDDPSTVSSPVAGRITVSEADAEDNITIRGGSGAVVGGGLIRCVYADGSEATAEANADGSFFLTVTAEVAAGGFDLIVIDSEGRESAATRISTIRARVSTEGITVSPPTAEGQVTIQGRAGTVVGGSRIQCIYADGSVVTGTANADGSFTLNADAALLGAGFELVVTDTEGNVLASGSVRTDAIVIEPLSIDFGAVRLESEKSATLSIENNTTEDFTVTGIVSTLGKDLQRSETNFTAVAGQTHEVILTFAPREAGMISGKLSIYTDRPDSRTLNVAITGQAISRGDVDGNGRVDIFDLVEAASRFGQVGIGLSGDVNEDGQVNIFDLVIIGNGFGQTAAAAPALAAASALPDGDVKQVRQALAALEAMNTPSQGTLIAIDFLRAWLDVVEPPVTETKLHPNYPNPFNPETWIPYQLAADADVTVKIYNIGGEQVRTLALGFKAKGYYTARDKAAYWDGRNDKGERTASGVYFYYLRAGEYAATRKMIVAK